MITINNPTKDDVINLCLDTINLKKQGIVFVNTKKSAEACAEKIATKLTITKETTEISKQIEQTLNNPTKQCKRLSKTLQKSIAFHHSGLHTEQRRIIEENFRDGKIKIICSTTTLGAGLDLPAYRTIIRDLKRFSPGWGSINIPVLEYEQMAGRAGRPKYDKEGEAICIATTNEEKEQIWQEYIHGEPENITSKLGVEPVLRTYTLSLVSSNYAKSFKEIINFLTQTLYAHQYRDLNKIKNIIHQVIDTLEEYEFIKTNRKKTHFKSALEEDFEIKPTQLGKKISDLYLDPYSAHELIQGMKGAKTKTTPYSVLQLITNTNEIRPLINARKKDEDKIHTKIIQEEHLTEEQSQYSENYYDYINSIKTAIVLEEWMNEKPEDEILEEHNVTPGELNTKIERANWILYSCQELTKIIPEIKKENLELHNIRERLKKGIKEELLPLVKLKGIGRIRARKLFNNKIRNIKDIKNTDLTTLTELIGQTTALNIKKQVGQNLQPEKIKTKENKRKGQINLTDYDEE